MTVTRGLRRRLDYRLLRWQARLDAEWADRVIPWAGSIGLFVVLAAMSLARVRSLETGTELATWVQGAWMIVHGIEPRSTITGEHILQPQLAVGFYPLAEVSRVVGTVPLLMVVQSLALAIGVTPIWRMSRRVCHLRVGAAGAAVIAYAAFPALQELNLSDFHPEALALPALLWATYQAIRGRWRWAVPLFVLALAMRSDLGLTVAALGVGLAWGFRVRGARSLALGGLIWTAVAQLVIQPWIGDSGFVHADAFTAYGDGFLDVVWGMATHPWDVVTDIVAQENFVLLIGLLAPVLFIPLLAPRIILPFVPVVCLFFVADVPIEGSAGVQLLVPAIVGIFVALPFGLERLGRRNIERVTVDTRVLGGLVLSSLAFSVLLSPASPYQHPWEWGGRDRADGARLEAVASIGADERVRASSTMVSRLAERRVIRPVVGESLDAEDLAEGVDVIVLGPEVTVEERGEGLFFDLGEMREPELEPGWAEALEELGFELVSDVEGVVVYRRGG